MHRLVDAAKRRQSPEPGGGEAFPDGTSQTARFIVFDDNLETVAARECAAYRKQWPTGPHADP